jgi:hypothetical protein
MTAIIVLSTSLYTCKYLGHRPDDGRRHKLRGRNVRANSAEGLLLTMGGEAGSTRCRRRCRGVRSVGRRATVSMQGVRV